MDTNLYMTLKLSLYLTNPVFLNFNPKYTFKRIPINLLSNELEDTME